jgi:hypothetical protein
MRRPLSVWKHLEQMLARRVLRCCGVGTIVAAPFFVAPIAFVSSTGCAALVAALPTVSEVVSDAVAILGMISQGVASYFRASPNPTKQAEIEAAIAKAQGALVLGEQGLAGVEHATQGQMAAAFASFAQAYSEMMALLGPLGIVSAQPTASTPADGGSGALMATQAPRLVVPTPLAVRAARK